MKQLFVASDSMLPSLASGDVIHVEKVNPFEIKIGDIIVYKNSKEKQITHRVIEIDRKREIIFTKGDNNSENSLEKIFFKQIIGKIIKVTKKNRNRKTLPINIKKLLSPLIGKLINLFHKVLHKDKNIFIAVFTIKQNWYRLRITNKNKNIGTIDLQFCNGRWIEKGRWIKWNYFSKNLDGKLNKFVYNIMSVNYSLESEY